MLQTFKKQRSKLTRDQEKKYRSVCASLAKAIRLADSDRLWIAHSEEAARRLGEEPGEEEQEAALDQLAQPDAVSARGTPHLPATATFKKYVEKMSGAAAHSRVVKNRFVKANLRLVVSIARRYNRGRLPADRPDPGGQHRPDEGGRALRPHARLSLLDVRVVVDPSRDQPRPRRQGPRRSHPRAHARHPQPHPARHAGGPRADGPRPHAGGARARDGHPAGEARQGEGLLGGDPLLARPPRGRRRRAQVHRLPPGRRTRSPPTTRSPTTSGTRRSGACSRR